MGLKSFTIPFSKIKKDPYLRNDVKYHNFLFSSDWNLFNTTNKKLVSLKDILLDDYALFVYKDNEEYKGIPTGQTYLDEDGEIIDYQTVTSDDHPGRLKYRIKNNNILLSSLRLARTPALYFENQDLSEYVFSNGFYIFSVNSNWNKKFILYILRAKKLKNILDNHIYRGIGISAYKKEDFLKIKIPIIPKPVQNKVVSQIEPIKKKINKLKNQINAPQKIINNILAKYFRFNINEVNKIERNKFFYITKDITYHNLYLRSSTRWHKIKPIQKELYKNNPYNIEKLGKYIVSTKNGWSPYCRESDSDYFVFSVNSISKDSYIKYDNLKNSNEYLKNISNYYAKENDLYISRGNTVDLVALASIVKNLPDNKNIVYPDLFIKLDINEKFLDKEYLAHLFNSIIGRYYFKYATKGKNQTMVKVSSEELKNFYLPIPPKNIQHKIIDEIKAELDKLEDIKKQIGIERNKIDEIIENTVK